MNNESKNEKKVSFFDNSNNSHLDDIDKFFYENFTELIDDTKSQKNIYDNLEILDIDNDIEILAIKDESLDMQHQKDNTVQIINDEAGLNVEILDFDECISDIEKLEFENDIQDNLFNNKKVNAWTEVFNVNDFKAEILDFQENIEILDIDNQDELPEILELDNKNNNFDICNINMYNEKLNTDNLISQEENKMFTQSNFVKNKVKYKNKNIQKIILIVILIILLILLFFVIYKIINWKLDNNNINKQVYEIQNSIKIDEIEDNENTIIFNNEIMQEDNTNDVFIDRNNDYWNFIKQPLISVDFSKLLEKNDDTVGWLQVNGTNINYPVVQTNNNEFYLKHSFDKKYNDAGWLFVDYRNNLIDDKNMIIYGHSRLNSTMFGTLKNVIKSSWYNNSSNHLIKLSMIDANTSWQVFSTYVIDSESYYIKTDFNDEQQYLDFLQNIKKRSVYNYNVNINENDRILTLSTCYSNNQRIVLHAKLIKIENR